MMKHTLVFIVGIFFSMITVAAEPGNVVVIPLKGEVSKAQFFFLRRAIKDAERSQATAIILDMDTYGGELQAATKMLDALFKTSLPTFTYINTNAGSAGALVALSTKKIYMAPVSAIGAAAPVIGGGQDLPSTLNDKVVSYFSGYFRSAAEKNGHNPEIAEAFISKDKEVKVGDQVIHPKGTLLTLSAQEAARAINGKPLLAAGITDSLPGLLTQAGLRGALRTVEPSGFEKLAFWITALAPLFLLGGILGAYIEFKAPGFGIAGMISITCFLIFFTGHYIAGLAGWEVFALFFVGLVLVIGEFILHPGTILPGVIGAFLMIGALLWAMIDRYPNQGLMPTGGMLLLPLINLGIAIVFGVIAIIFLAKFLPHTSMYHRLVLGMSSSHGPSFSMSSSPSSDSPTVGLEGIAKTSLRPSGKADFGGLLLDVVTEGKFINLNTKLYILAIEGSRIVVEEKETV